MIALKLLFLSWLRNLSWPPGICASLSPIGMYCGLMPMFSSNSFLLIALVWLCVLVFSSIKLPLKQKSCSALKETKQPFFFLRRPDNHSNACFRLKTLRNPGFPRPAFSRKINCMRSLSPKLGVVNV